jgi:ferredoxin
MEESSALCGHCQLIFLPESFDVDEEGEAIITKYSRTDTLPGLQNSLRDAVAGCTFCVELKKRTSAHEWPGNVRDITIGPATLLHESLGSAEHTPEQEGLFD